MNKRVDIQQTILRAVNSVPADRPFDTVYITQLYLERPAVLANYSLGRWFACAHDMQEKNKYLYNELVNSVGNQATKMLLVEKKLTYYSLTPLAAYNDAMAEQQSKERNSWKR